MPKFNAQTLFNLTNNSISRRYSRLINIPDDISPFITYDASAEIEPQDVGMNARGIDEIWQSVQDLYRSGITPGVSICVRKNGHVVLDRAIGHAQGNGPNETGIPKVLLTPQTPICQYSASKAVTAMLIHLLAERGDINLLDPVSKYIPEFAANDKSHTTIYHVLTHKAGFPKLPSHLAFEALLEPQTVLGALYSGKADTFGGDSKAYHAITGGLVLGEIIERVSGMDIRDFIRINIAEPLGMTHFNYGINNKQLGDVATNYPTGLPVFPPIDKVLSGALGAKFDRLIDVSNMPAFHKIAVPSANLMSTANDMSLFYQLLLNSGEVGGQRIFQADTVQRSIIHTGDTSLDGSIFLPIKYSAGHMLGSAPIGIYGANAQNAYGHVGFINTWCWADPDRNIAASIQTTGKCLASPHLFAFVKLLTAINRNTQD